MQKWIVLILVLVVLTGCSRGDKTPNTAPASSATPSPSSPSAPAPALEATPGKAAGTPVPPGALSEADWAKAEAAVRTALRADTGSLPLFPITLPNVPKDYAYVVATPRGEMFYLVGLPADFSRAVVLASARDVTVNTAKVNVSALGDKITVWSQVPNGAFEKTVVLEWTGMTARVLSSKTTDPTATFYANKRKLVEAGELNALMMLNSKDILYPAAYNEYYSLPPEIAKLAHKKSLEAYRAGDTAGALKMLEFGVRQYTSVFGETWDKPTHSGALPLADTIPIINDYGFFLSENGRDREAEPWLRQVLNVAPNRTPAYLNLADVLWKLGRTAEAKPYYRTYLEKVDKSVTPVPPRVNERLGSK